MVMVMAGCDVVPVQPAVAAAEVRPVEVSFAVTVNVSVEASVTVIEEPVSPGITVPFFFHSKVKGPGLPDGVAVKVAG